MYSKKPATGALTRSRSSTIGMKPDGSAAGARSEPSLRKPSTAKSPKKEEADCVTPAVPFLGTLQDSAVDTAAEVARLREEVNELSRRLTTFQLVVAQQMEDSDIRLTEVTSQMKESQPAPEVTQDESGGVRRREHPGRSIPWEASDDSDSDIIDGHPSRARPTRDTSALGDRPATNREPGLPVVIPSRTIFTKAVSFETYRLSNRSAAYSSGIAAHVSSWRKRMRHSFREEAFDGRDPSG